ncbi:MAG: ABC transporter ATP-binding protein [Phycisphaerae bacterium]|jgi:ATP-binding cassette, subfamily B, bacterial MsbA|nr:ABC transporter ATP-binding protein [Phycisphaerae bacterium]MBT5583268.1 ABC transporter ATP-binding protein [Phycisphaerae bacterium]
MAPFWTLAKHLLERRGMLVLAVVMAFVSAAGLGIGLLSLGPVLEQILHPDTGRDLRQLAENVNSTGGFWHVPDGLVAVLPEGRFNGVLFLICVIWILTLVGAAANFLHQYISQTLATLTIARIRKRIFDHVLHLPLSRVVQQGPSEYISRIIRDTAALEAGFIALLGKSVAQLTKGLAALGVAVIFDWTIVVVALIVGPILGIVLRKLAKRIRRGSHGSLVAQQDLLQLSNERVQGLRAVKTSTAESLASSHFDEVNKEVVRHELKMRTAKAMSSPIMETLAIIVLGALALLAAKSILSGELPFERFLLSVGSLAVAGASFRPLAGIITSISTAAAPAERILEVLDEHVEPQDGVAMKRHVKSVSFEGVSQIYPGAKRPSVDGVDLQVGFGEHIAIVGPNGSGKTTLLSLIPRLLTPASGTVRVDGVDISSVQLSDLRNQIGVVTQESFIVRGTIAANIALGRPGASMDDIRAAATASHAERFIQELPEGYDTVVAEHGASLSGGQRQRLSIARALLREPSILILDEATSQVDSESEASIAAAIQEISDCTVFVIAHRLATVLDCDRIVVMDEGRVVDAGPHGELLSRCELYDRLIRTQLVAVDT